MEFAVGRAAQTSPIHMYQKLQKPGGKWGILGYICLLGNIALMTFYTVVAGWLIYYFVKFLTGQNGSFGFEEMIANPGINVTYLFVSVLLAFLILSFGLQGGLERVTKYMMTSLMVLILILAVRSFMLPGAAEGLRFYLIPDFSRITGKVVVNAMNQAFFTLSIGIGAMLIFGSYMEKDQRLFGEAVNITVLDTIVALMAGFIIIPACFAYGIEPGAGPSLIFITIPNIFAQVAGGRVWGGLFFLFLSFAAFTTLVAVFENIISFDMDLFGWSRKKSTLVSLILIIILSMPCVMGFNVLAGFTPLGEGSTIMDLEDFIVSNNLLPLGSLGYVLFCTKKNGWGWNHFLKEINQGEGWKFPSGIKGYMSYGLPLLIIIIYLKGYYDKFQPMGTKVLVGWMIVAILFLTFVIGCSCGKSNAEKVDK